MKLNGSILVSSFCAIILTGCGGVQNGTVTPVTAAQSKMRQASGSSDDLLYAVGLSNEQGSLHAFTFPDGQQLSRQPVAATEGLCSDTNGNIYVPRFEGIDEYAHGGKHAIAKIDDPGYNARGCSIDPTTGNLAVTNAQRQESTSGNVVVYANAKGRPFTYTDPQMYYYGFCGYDDNGNLFVVGSTQAEAVILAELPRGHKKFTNITVDRSFYFGAVQWDGAYLAVQGDQTHIYRVSVSGSTGTVVQSIVIRHTRGINQFWIQGNIVAVTSWNDALYPYPRGGKPIAFFSKRGHVGVHLYGVTVSVAPTALRK